MAGLRATALDLDPAEFGFEPTPDLPRVFGAVVDLWYPPTWVSVVGFIDGTTSLYTGTGGGMLGAGEHESAARATRQLLAGFEGALDAFQEDSGTATPGQGMVVFHALTYAGRRRAAAPRDELEAARHPLAVLFFLTHDVITELRLLDQNKP